MITVPLLVVYSLGSESSMAGSEALPVRLLFDDMGPGDQPEFPPPITLGVGHAISHSIWSPAGDRVIVIESESKAAWIIDIASRRKHLLSAKWPVEAMRYDWSQDERAIVSFRMDSGHEHEVDLVVIRGNDLMVDSTIRSYCIKAGTGPVDIREETLHPHKGIVHDALWGNLTGRVLCFADDACLPIDPPAASGLRSHPAPLASVRVSDGCAEVELGKKRFVLSGCIAGARIGLDERLHYWTRSSAGKAEVRCNLDGSSRTLMDSRGAYPCYSTNGDISPDGRFIIDFWYSGHGEDDQQSGISLKAFCLQGWGTSPVRIKGDPELLGWSTNPRYLYCISHGDLALVDIKAP